MNTIRNATVAAAIAVAAALATAEPSAAEEVWQTLPQHAPMPAPVESGMAPVNDIEMYYAVYGAGEPLIMLHGGLAHSDVWGMQIPAFAERYKVIVADSRGHGRSTRSAQPYGYALMASDVVALMDHLKIDKAALVGWSDGGIIGLHIAMNDPERLTRLFAFGANYNVGGLKEDVGTNANFNAYIERMAGDYQTMSKTPGEFDAFVAQIGEMWATQPDYSAEQLGAIAVPTAIVDGAHDEGIKLEHTEEMAKLIPGAELIVFPDASHFAFLQKPEEFNKAVLDFLAKE
jgi:pimeloyl-ACP methyl ester carboxylesterase